MGLHRPSSRHFRKWMKAEWDSCTGISHGDKGSSWQCWTSWFSSHTTWPGSMVKFFLSHFSSIHLPEQGYWQELFNSLLCLYFLSSRTCKDRSSLSYNLFLCVTQLTQLESKDIITDSCQNFPSHVLIRQSFSNTDFQNENKHPSLMSTPSSLMFSPDCQCKWSSVIWEGNCPD